MEILDSISKEKYAAYLSLFKGEVASANQINREHPFLNIAIDNMVKKGGIVGQRSFLNQEVELEEDIYYWMPGKIPTV